MAIQNEEEVIKGGIYTLSEPVTSAGSFSRIKMSA